MATRDKAKVKYMPIPTPKQRKLAKAVVDNLRPDVKTETTKALMLKVGYSEVQANASTQITKSQGFLKALDELGLTDEFIVSALVTDIREKPQRRAFELSIAAKIRGLDRRADDSQAHTQNMAINNAIIIVQSPDKRLD